MNENLGGATKRRAWRSAVGLAVGVAALAWIAVSVVRGRALDADRAALVDRLALLRADERRLSAEIDQLLGSAVRDFDAVGALRETIGRSGRLRADFILSPEWVPDGWPDATARAPVDLATAESERARLERCFEAMRAVIDGPGRPADPWRASVAERARRAVEQGRPRRPLND